jgi:hypothetical protein
VSIADATMNGTVDPENLPTTYHFDYGRTADYGLRAPAESGSVGSDTDAGIHDVIEHVSGLTPGMTYHFRIVATNSRGTVNGQDQEFRTSPDISDLSLRPARFYVTRRGSGAGIRRHGGTDVHFRMVQPATVSFTVERVLSRRRRRAGCGRLPRVRRKPGSCSVAVGTWAFRRAARSGHNSFAFTGRVAGRALRPGRYRLGATGLAAFGPISAPVWADFTIESRRSGS